MIIHQTGNGSCCWEIYILDTFQGMDTSAPREYLIFRKTIEQMMMGSSNHPINANQKLCQAKEKSYQCRAISYFVLCPLCIHQYNVSLFWTDKMSAFTVKYNQIRTETYINYQGLLSLSYMQRILQVIPIETHRNRDPRETHISKDSAFRW